jgi:hypothetical protein
MPVSLKKKKIHISRLGSKKIVAIDKDFTGRNLADIVYQLGKGESNIVYQNRTDYCENVARKISNLIPGDKDSQALNEGADYIEKFLHQDFSLAGNLKKGVAFHYGPLPGVVRTMIENLVREKEVDVVVCTGTLAEGVNLPAKNLFFQNPMVMKYGPPEKLESVKLDNITGRAGRMLEHFAGNIFLIEPDRWNFQYFEENEEEVEKIPTYFRVINEDLNGVLEALDGVYDYRSEYQYTYYTIANKLLKELNSDILSSTLKAPELTLKAEERAQLEASVYKAYSELKIDTFTLEANPTFGFIQQNKLYDFLVKHDDLTELVLPHPKSPLLYERLNRVCEVLSDVGLFLPKESSVAFACIIANKWILSEPLKAIIAEQISYDNSEGEEYNCNRSVRNVIKIINNDVRFRMSSALRCYHTLITDVLSGSNKNLQSTKIYSFIEVGSCDDRVIKLVNLGLSRETALEVNRILPVVVSVDSLGELRAHFNSEVFNELHVVTKREISNLLT